MANSVPVATSGGTSVMLTRDYCSFSPSIQVRMLVSMLINVRSTFARHSCELKFPSTLFQKVKSNLQEEKRAMERQAHEHDKESSEGPAQIASLEDALLQVYWEPSRSITETKWRC